MTNDFPILTISVSGDAESDDYSYVCRSHDKYETSPFKSDTDSHRTEKELELSSNNIRSDRSSASDSWITEKVLVNDSSPGLSHAIIDRPLGGYDDPLRGDHSDQSDSDIEINDTNSNTTWPISCSSHFSEIDEATPLSGFVNTKAMISDNKTFLYHTNLHNSFGPQRGYPTALIHDSNKHALFKPMVSSSSVAGLSQMPQNSQNLSMKSSSSSGSRSMNGSVLSEDGSTLHASRPIAMDLRNPSTHGDTPLVRNGMSSSIGTLQSSFQYSNLGSSMPHSNLGNMQYHDIQDMQQRMSPAHSNISQNERNQFGRAVQAASCSYSSSDGSTGQKPRMSPLVSSIQNEAMIRSTVATDRYSTTDITPAVTNTGFYQDSARESTRNSVEFKNERVYRHDGDMSMVVNDRHSSNGHSSSRNNPNNIISLDGSGGNRVDISSPINISNSCVYSSNSSQLNNSGYTNTRNPSIRESDSHGSINPIRSSNQVGHGTSSHRSNPLSSNHSINSPNSHVSSPFNIVNPQSIHGSNQFIIGKDLSSPQSNHLHPVSGDQSDSSVFSSEQSSNSSSSSKHHDITAGKSPSSVVLTNRSKQSIGRVSVNDEITILGSNGVRNMSSKEEVDSRCSTDVRYNAQYSDQSSRKGSSSHYANGSSKHSMGSNRNSNGDHSSRQSKDNTSNRSNKDNTSSSSEDEDRSNQSTRLKSTSSSSNSTSSSRLLDSHRPMTKQVIKAELLGSEPRLMSSTSSSLSPCREDDDVLEDTSPSRLLSNDIKIPTIHSSPINDTRRAMGYISKSESSKFGSPRVGNAAKNSAPSSRQSSNGSIPMYNSDEPIRSISSNTLSSGSLLHDGAKQVSIGGNDSDSVSIASHTSYARKSSHASGATHKSTASRLSRVSNVSHISRKDISRSPREDDSSSSSSSSTSVKSSSDTQSKSNSSLYDKNSSSSKVSSIKLPSSGSGYSKKSTYRSSSKISPNARSDKISGMTSKGSKSSVSVASTGRRSSISKSRQKQKKSRSKTDFAITPYHGDIVTAPEFRPIPGYYPFGTSPKTSEVAEFVRQWRILHNY